MPHHELSYTSSTPDVICFRCDTPPETAGGETTVFDGRRALSFLTQEMREKLQKDRVLYTRRLVDGSSAKVSPVLTWQHVFGATTLAEALSVAVSRGYEVLSSSEDSMVYSFATHLAFADRLNASDVDPTIFDEFYMGEWEKVYSLTWEGTGEPLERSTVLEICAAYAQARLHFRWCRRGEVAILNNRWMAHGRTPYPGKNRRITSQLGSWSAV